MTDQETTMPTVTGKYHPAALVLPEMTEQEYRELVDDIREHGQREPISEDEDGRILDGGHRWRACQELGIEPNIVRHAPPFDGPELEAWKIQFVISRNIHRRHLTTTQRAAIAAELATMKRGTRTDLPSNDGKSPGLSNNKPPR
jgi:ParB-like chromosome segregation protein Spo0J